MCHSTDMLTPCIQEELDVLVLKFQNRQLASRLRRQKQVSLGDLLSLLEMSELVDHTLPLKVLWADRCIGGDPTGWVYQQTSAGA